MLRNKSVSNQATNILINILFAVFIGLLMMPIVFMFSASFMKSSEIFRMPYRWIPKDFFMKNYYNAVTDYGKNYTFLRTVMNSLIVALSTTILSVLVSSFAGYGLSKFTFKGQKIVFLMIMGRMMIPFEAIMIPMYMIAISLHLQNTYTGLVLPFVLNTFGVFQMRQYLLSFPDEMLDAGRIDGLGEFRLFKHLVFRNSTPAIATAAILCFRGQWDNLLWPLLLSQKEVMKTIPAYLVKFTEEKYADEGAMMAVAMMASIPIIVLFLSLSKYFLGGNVMFSSSKE
ncbi:multiple sugar transport system permease protein [Sphaerochaeta associata]|nr:multiple sugar transport system permease protein [Sphaerochaeta associata]